MKELEFKHLIPYLLYGLQIKITEEFFVPFKKNPLQKKGSIITLGYTTLILMSEGLKFKPFLRPLSDLTKEIEHNGEKFVPYNKLKTMVSEEQWVKICNSIDTDKNGIYNKFSDMPYWWTNQCIKWHFDIYGLIKEGLALKK